MNIDALCSNVYITNVSKLIRRCYSVSQQQSVKLALNDELLWPCTIYLLLTAILSL